MSEVTVRPARPGEYTAVGELTVRAYRDGGFLGYETSDEYAAELRDAEGRAAHADVLVAVDGEDTVLGTVTAARYGTPYAELAREGELEFRMLAVRPDAHGRGIGEALVRAVVDHARELGLTGVALCSQQEMTTAHRIYTRLGFRRDPARDWRPAPTVPLIAFSLTL